MPWKVRPIVLKKHLVYWVMISGTEHSLRAILYSEC